jgi:uncharacterized protein YuzE
MEKAVKKQKMVQYDKKNDVLYFGVRSGDEEEFVELAPGVAVELDKKKGVIGIEVLNASKILGPLLKTS